MLKGLNVGGLDAGAVFDQEDDTCDHVNEAGQKCIRPRGHTVGLHRYPETEENDRGD